MLHFEDYIRPREIDHTAFNRPRDATTNSTRRMSSQTAKPYVDLTWLQVIVS